MENTEDSGKSSGDVVGEKTDSCNSEIPFYLSDTPPPVYEMPEKDKKRTYGSVTYNYLDTTSAHALPHLISQKTKLQKFIWFLIFWAAMGYSFYQLRGIVVEFRKYQVTVKTVVRHRTVADFPAVTICNENKLKKNKISGTPFQSILKLENKIMKKNDDAYASDDGDYSDEDSGYDSQSYDSDVQEFHQQEDEDGDYDTLGSDDLFVGLRGEHDYEKLFNLSRTTDYSDVINMLRPNTTELDLYGHQEKDFILQCTFDGENCKDYHFTKFYNEAFGNCYTFNGMNQNNTVVRTSKFGSKFGLKLSLNVEADEYLGLFTHQIGAKISIHPSNMTPFPEDSAVSAPVGKLTDIALSSNLLEGVQSPYETNCSTGEGLYLFYPGDYTAQNCMHSCLRKALLEDCHCVETIDVGPRETKCKISNVTQVICRLNVYKKFKNNKYPCQQGCNEPCHQVTYNILASYSEWPTEVYRALLKDQLDKRNISADGYFLEGNILRANIYFKTLSYSYQGAFPTYTWETLLANIGGTWGLFIGFSVCTFLEAAEYFLELISLVFRSCCCKSKEKAISPKK